MRRHHPWVGWPGLSLRNPGRGIADSAPATPRSRRGYTLLEVIVTLAIAALVMSGLYVALFTQLRLAQSGRDVIQRSTSARNLLNRISTDVANHLGPMSAWLLQNAPSTSGSSTPSQNQSGNSADSSAPMDSTTSPATQDNMATGSASGVFNVCVSGTTSYLRLSLTRFPRPGKEDEVVSDLARIEYWIVEGKGLARREVTRITAADEDVEATLLPEQEKYVIEGGVDSVTFRYWDGSAWQESWNGLEPGSDENQTPLGPPAAIEITLKLRTRTGGDQDEFREYQHVVAIRTANIVQQTTAP